MENKLVKYAYNFFRMDSLNIRFEEGIRYMKPSFSPNRETTIWLKGLGDIPLKNFLSYCDQQGYFCTPPSAPFNRETNFIKKFGGYLEEVTYRMNSYFNSNIHERFTPQEFYNMGKPEEISMEITKEFTSK